MVLIRILKINDESYEIEERFVELISVYELTRFYVSKNLLLKI